VTTHNHIDSISVSSNLLINAVQSEVRVLKAKGVNKIILLSHSSYAIDKEIAANTDGVDVIVGGHDNTLLSNTNKRAVGPYPTVVNDVQIIQAYAYGKYLGELVLVFDDVGNVISAEGEPILIDSSVEEDPQIVTRLDILEKPINKLKETQDGNVSASLIASAIIFPISHSWTRHTALSPLSNAETFPSWVSLSLLIGFSKISKRVTI
jgi:5'-nucleotidase